MIVLKTNTETNETMDLYYVHVDYVKLETKVDFPREFLFALKWAKVSQERVFLKFHLKFGNYFLLEEIRNKRSHNSVF